MNLKLGSDLFNGTDCEQDTFANCAFFDVNVPEERKGVAGYEIREGAHCVPNHSSLPFFSAVAEGEGPGSWKTLTGK